MFTIKDIKLGNKSIKHPKVTTIYDDEKVTFRVPFDKALKYEFMKVEEDMIFKFALLGEDDLLGFIYIEIPHRFKAIKNFTIDDWFPIKQIEVEDEVKLNIKNFMARIILKYRASKIYRVDDRFENHLTMKVGYQDLGKNLKDKVKHLHQDIDEF